MKPMPGHPTGLTRTSDKLRHLADHLDAMDDRWWDFGTFGRTTTFLPGMECGTVACAAGHLPDAFPECPPLTLDHGFFDKCQAIEFLGLDTTCKRRPGEAKGMDDFDRMFQDADRRLRGDGVADVTCPECLARFMSDVPKAAVTRRLRRMADHYAVMGR